MHNIITKKVGLNRILAGGVKGPTAPVAGLRLWGAERKKTRPFIIKEAAPRLYVALLLLLPLEHGTPFEEVEVSKNAMAKNVFEYFSPDKR